MSFKLSPEHQELRLRVRELVTSIGTEARRADQRGEFPSRIWTVLRQHGLTGMLAGREGGGCGQGVTGVAVVAEELARVNAGLAQSYQASECLALAPLVKFGTADQKRRYLPMLLEGAVGACAISEANAGSDAAALETEARPEGDGWVLNGRKRFLTNATVAELFVILATVDRSKGHRGITAFLVERDTPGLAVGKPIEMLGLRSSPHSGLILRDCRIGKEALLGEAGRGFKIALTGLDLARVGWAGISIGLAKAAMEAAVDFARKRHQFGQAVAEFQGIQWMLAEAATRLEASEHLAYWAAALADDGQPFSREAAMAKFFASEVAENVARMAMQIHGGQGYLEDSDLGRIFRDARATAIVGGTSEIQKTIIARSVLADGAK